MKTKSLSLYIFNILIAASIFWGCVQKQETNNFEEKVPKSITDKKGIIHIPGIAFIDGRDLEAIQPLTISQINIWDSYERNRVVCKISHGTQVEVITAKLNHYDNRYYIKIRSNNCEGWVSYPFLSENYNKPIGDIF